jgi:MurNAc alpha-1-phosphate uridylyltransferase
MTAIPPVMIFAAGLGTRLRPLTESLPKALVPVAGRPLIDRALDLARGAGARRAVVNLHHLGQMIADHLAGQGDIAFSCERDALLDTGGGLRAALPLLGPGPVLTLNSDAVWTGANPLVQLLAAWDPARMSGLLLTLPADLATGHAGTGDFLADAEGRLRRAAGAPGDVYLGAQILTTGELDAFAEPAFSINRLWDRMIAEGRLFGLRHRGGWCDAGTHAGLAGAEALLRGAA